MNRTYKFVTPVNEQLAQLQAQNKQLVKQLQWSYAAMEGAVRFIGQMGAPRSIFENKTIYDTSSNERKTIADIIRDMRNTLGDRTPYPKEG